MQWTSPKGQVSSYQGWPWRQTPPTVEGSISGLGLHPYTSVYYLLLLLICVAGDGLVSQFFALRRGSYYVPWLHLNLQQSCHSFPNVEITDVSPHAQLCGPDLN